MRIDATDAEDARQRIGKLAYATYDGVIISSTPIIHAPIEIVTVWVRNALNHIISRFK